MRKLFNGEARYPDLDCSYDYYLSRRGESERSSTLSREDFNRVVKMYCKSLAEDLCSTGSIDLPCDMGMIAAVRVKRKPVFNTRTGKYTTGSSVDWDRTREEGKIVFGDGNDAFGFVFVPKWKKGNENLRCVGIRANKELYRKMKDMYNEGTLDFYLPDSDNFIV